MANQKHLGILKRGVEMWNQWREKHDDIQPDLRGDDLSETNLYDANLYNADLSRSHHSLATVAVRESDTQLGQLSRSALRPEEGGFRVSWKPDALVESHS